MLQAGKIEMIMRQVWRERERQVAKWGDKPRSVSDYLVIINQELMEANSAWVKHPGDLLALKELLQVLTLALFCIEENTEESSMLYGGDQWKPT